MKPIKKTERILGLINVLKKYSDEENELTLQEIIDLLHEEFNDEVEFSKVALSNDLKELAHSKYIDIIINNERNGLPKYYSYKNRLLEIQELRLLMDAISSARFITKKDKEIILEKIKRLTSVSLANNLQNQIYLEDYAISGANRVKYTIFTLHNAIHEKKMIQFKYGRYNVQKEFILSHNGLTRELHPYALLWNNDYYYLIGKYNGKEDMVHLRVDLIVDVNMTDQTLKMDEHFDISEYMKRLFHMYSGAEKDLKVRMNNGLINVMIDRFGEDVYIEEDGADAFILRTKAIISDGLVKWLLTWGSDAKVIDPPELVQMMKEECEKMYKMYKD